MINLNQIQSILRSYIIPNNFLFDFWRKVTKLETIILKFCNSLALSTPIPREKIFFFWHSPLTSIVWETFCENTSQKLKTWTLLLFYNVGKTLLVSDKVLWEKTWFGQYQNLALKLIRSELTDCNNIITYKFQTLNKFK